VILGLNKMTPYRKLRCGCESRACWRRTKIRGDKKAVRQGLKRDLEDRIKDVRRCQRLWETDLN